MSDSEIPQARQFMNAKVHCAHPAMTLAEATAFLRTHEVSSVPVVEQGPQGERLLVGFLSEADCLEHLVNEVFFGRPELPQTAGTMMKRHPVCVSPETDIFSLASIFVSHHYRHLPVVDEQQQLLGIVSRRDILRALDEVDSERIDELRLQRSPRDLHEIQNLRFVARTL